MHKLSVHKSSLLFDFGVYFKTISSDTANNTIAYSHSDDYYIFGLVEKGNCHLNIDFKDYIFDEKDLFIIHARQVHSFISSSNLSASILMVDSVFINDEEKRILEQYGNQKISLDNFDEMKPLFSLISKKIKHTDTSAVKVVIQRLAILIVGFVIEAIISHTQSQKTKGRYEEIVCQFRELLKKHIKTNRLPSYYAERLNISTSYLNEAINAVMGTNTNQYIQNEIILIAKRQLAYTTDSVKEIALDLGFNDYSYFTRTFTKISGISPSQFRNNTTNNATIPPDCPLS